MGNKLKRKEKQVTNQLIEQDIAKTDIMTELMIMTNICMAFDIMLRNNDDRLKSIYRKYGLVVKVSENDNLIKGMSRYCASVKAALYWFERDIEHYSTDCTFESNGVTAFDDFRKIANDLIKVVLLAFDRGCAAKTLAPIVDAIRQLPSGGFLFDEDINQYTMK